MARGSIQMPLAWVARCGAKSHRWLPVSRMRRIGGGLGRGGHLRQWIRVAAEEGLLTTETRSDEDDKLGTVAAWVVREI